MIVKSNLVEDVIFSFSLSSLLLPLQIVRDFDMELDEIEVPIKYNEPEFILIKINKVSISLSQ